MENYLEELPLSDDEKLKLNELAAGSPASLLGMIEANTEAFQNYLGEDKLSEIETRLQEMVSDEDSEILRNTSVPHFGLGARMHGNPVKLNEPDYDIEKRDRLFDELQYLKSQDSSSGKTRERISHITEELNKMLK